MKLTQSTLVIRLLLYIAIFLALNLLASSSFFRLDFTADKRYTLSESTKDILQNLDEPVTVTAYFSDNLPAQLKVVEGDFKDLLSEYRTKSGNNVVYEFIDPTDDEALQAEIGQGGIYPLQIQAREKDEITTVQAFAGAIVKSGNQQEVLPRVLQISGLEYSLSAAIKKMSVADKPKIGFIQGHGEPGLDKLIQAQQELANLYQIDTVSLSGGPAAWADFKTLVLLGPSSTIPPDELAQLDEFLASGGRLFVGINAVGGDLQAQAPWDRISTGLENWLTGKGVMVEQAFVLDAVSAQINMQRRQGFFVVNQPINFYYFPNIRNFKEHPVTTGLEEVMLQFASPITIINTDSSVRISPLATTSEQSGKQAPPAYFNPEKQWTQADFSYGLQNVAVSLEGKMGGETETKMVVIADGDFPLNPSPQQPAPANNVNLLVNSIDWLTDDTGLIALRTKGVEARPLQKLMGEEDAGTRTVVKILNFLLPLLIVIIFGIIRNQKRKTQALKWKAEDYS
ncbi:MAG: Gldg family protein [Bacteroidota bacterium]